MPATSTLPDAPFQEASLAEKPIRDLGLTIAGTRLEPVIEELRAELARAGIDRVKPCFYLSTEWGVPFGTVSIAIPFYLATPALTAFHAERTGFAEGVGRRELLRYLRHEMGHVLNYAYRLYDEEEWVSLFGPITRPYLEDYRPQPFSRRHVRHLPGWYAQKHPDEDWSETFAVWLTPGLDWRAEYAGWPEALAKLEYVGRTVAALAGREPPVTATELDEDVAEIPYTLDQYYGRGDGARGDFPPGLDGALKALFDDLGRPEDSAELPRRPAAALIRRLSHTLPADVYRWTGHFPERSRVLMRYLAERAEVLKLFYPEEREEAAVVALTVLVSALAGNFVYRGGYLP